MNWAHFSLWYETRLAMEFLREGRAQTLLIILGVGLGVAVIVFVVALISGLQQNLIERTLGTQPHLSLKAPENAVRALDEGAGAIVMAQQLNQRAQRLRSLQNWQNLMDTLEHKPGVTAVSPLVSGPALARRGQAFESVALMGVDPERYARIVPVPQAMVSGVFRPSANEIVIGDALAERLGVAVGGRVRLEGTNGRSGTFQVVGIFSLGVRDLDQSFVFIPIRPAQTLLDLPGGVTRIDITIDQIFDAEELASELALQLRVDAQSWMETNAQLLSGLRAQSQSTNLIQTFVGISVAFGIASVLAVSVVQRRGEIGILRAMGSTASQIMKIFLIQGAIVGLIGSLLGVLTGLGLVQLFGILGARPAEDGFFEISAGLTLIFSAMMLATISGTLAAYFPARRAARMDPVAAIRNE